MRPLVRDHQARWTTDLEATVSRTRNNCMQVLFAGGFASARCYLPTSPELMFDSSLTNSGRNPKDDPICGQQEMNLTNPQQVMKV